MGLFIFVLLIILGFGYPRSKGISFICAIYMFVILGLNTKSADIGQFKFVYENLFELGLLNHYEPAYSLFMAVCRSINIDFVAFRIIWAIIVIAFIEMTIKRTTKNTAMASAMYMLFVLLLVVSGMRMCISSAIASYGVSFLADKKKDKKAFVFVTLAVLFHYSSAFYYIFFIYEKIKREREIVRKKFIVLLCVLLVGCIVVRYTNLLYFIISRFTSRDKTLQWFDTGLSRPSIYGFILASMVVIVNLFFARKSLFSSMLNDLEDKYVILSYDISECLLFLNPLLSINVNFLRIYVGILPLILFSIASVLYPNLNTNRITRIYRVSYLSVSIFLWGLLYLVYQGYIYYRGSGLFLFDALKDNIVFGML